MKKLVFISVLSIMLFSTFSCSSDDATTEPVAQNFDAIIGTWKLTAKTRQQGSNAPVNDLENCETLNTYVFTGSANVKNGNGTVTLFSQNSNFACVQSGVYAYDWENIGNFIYNFKQTISGQVYVEAITVNFSNENKIMKFTTVDGPYTFVQTFAKQ